MIATSVFLSILAWLVVSLVALCAVLLLSAALYIVSVRSKYNHLPSPPYNSFFFGHVLELKRCSDHGYSGNLFLKWTEEQGPVFVLYILHKCIVFTNSTSCVKELLTKTKYPKSIATYSTLYSLFGCRFLGNGLLTDTDHQRWRKRHVVVNPAFNKKYLMMFMDQFNIVADRWIESLKPIADGKTSFDMHEYLCQVTLDALAEVGFNENFNAIESKDNQFLVAILTCLRGLFIARDPFTKIWPSLSEFRQKARDSVKLVRDKGQMLLDKRAALMKTGQPIPQDILSHIIKCKEMDPTLTNEDLLDDFLTLFFAGQETTSNVLAFIFSEVGRKPEVLQKLQDEIDEVMGSRTDVEYEDLGRLTYCGQVFKEILRLYPVGPGTARENTEEIILEGHRIPAKSNVVIQFYAMHRLSSYWDEPHEFCPERFEDSKPRQLYAYLPFSIGQRACLGQQFSKIETKVLMCKFFRNFVFNVDVSKRVEIEETTTLRPRGGVTMTLSHRH